MSRVITVASVQINLADLPEQTTVADNRERMAAMIDQAGQLGADLVCLPECCTTLQVPADDPERIEPLPGPSVARWAELAEQHRLTIVGWQYEASEQGYYNTAVVIGPDGELIGSYRKVHLTPQGLQAGCLPGDSYPVFETPVGRLGVMICYDAYFPETARLLALRGAEVICYPTMADARGEAIWELVARARAVDNAAYVVASVARSPRYGCYSAVFSPAGRIVGARPVPTGGLAVATIDLSEPYISEGHSGIPEPARMRELYWYSRRPQTYAGLTERRCILSLEDVRARPGSGT